MEKLDRGATCYNESIVTGELATLDSTKFLWRTPMPRPILHVIGPSIAYVVLTRGHFSVINIDDAEAVGKYSWYAEIKDGHRVYARKTGKRRDWLHRYLMGIDSRTSDHINGMTLDNRIQNLRLATMSQQNMNRRKASTKHGLKGVYAEGARFRSCLTVNRKRVWRQTFDTPEAAHAAYCLAAARFHGDFARVE